MYKPTTLQLLFVTALSRGSFKVFLKFSNVKNILYNYEFEFNIPMVYLWHYIFYSHIIFEILEGDALANKLSTLKK